MQIKNLLLIKNNFKSISKERKVKSLERILNLYSKLHAEDVSVDTTNNTTLSVIVQIVIFVSISIVTPLLKMDYVKHVFIGKNLVLKFEQSSVSSVQIEVSFLFLSNQLKKGFLSMYSVCLSMVYGSWKMVNSNSNKIT